MRYKNLFPLVPAAAILLSAIFSHSCANTTGSPEGGPKDTIPPILVDVKPFPGTLNVPTHGTEIVFTFNEYVQCKTPTKITLSPPLDKPLKTKLRGKSVVITCESDLKPNTTYTVDVTGAIVDNNESNPFAGYTLVFSTGEYIDSMFVTGIVQDSKTLKPVKDASVMLYKDHADSAIYRHIPDAMAKTDDWGFFCIRNIADTVYRMYAIKDGNNNRMYDESTEEVAFLDSLVTPKHVVGENVYELFKFDMKDTLSCQKRQTDYELNTFMSANSRQGIQNHGRIGERTAFVKFYSHEAEVDTLWFKGISAKRTIAQFNADKDSLVIWINSQKTQPDTLELHINYTKTDSLNHPVKASDIFKLAKDKKLQAKSSVRDLKHKDTIAIYTVDSKADKFEQDGIRIEFEYPLVTEAMDHLVYEAENARKNKVDVKYTWERDTTDIRAFIVRNVGKVDPTLNYTLKIPHRSFMDINGYYNDSTVVKIKLPNDDKLSTMTVNVTGVENTRYIVELLSGAKDAVNRSYIINSNCVLAFPYLKEGEYRLRITEDKNNNGKLDTGNLLAHKQPEKVRFYKLDNGKNIIRIPASAELSQDINLKEIFN